jgi:SAM-dependent methyltransferase
MHKIAAAAGLLTLAVIAAAQTLRIPYQAAAPVIDALASDLPANLRDKSAAEVASLWPAWVTSSDRAIRARVARGDEDSLVNLWLYGTSFTARARATAGEASAPASSVEEIARLRLEDFLDGVAAPGANERLQFARRVLAERGADPSTPAGRERARRYMVDARRRVIDEFAATNRALASEATSTDPGARVAAYASIFRERGLSSDTSILADFGVATALEAIGRQGLLRAGGVRRVAVVGPGLDFTNKADGYDFYPQQTIQPFALVDTLTRLGLAAAGLRITTIDLSARVNDHLAAAVDRVSAGGSYVVTLPMDADEEWHASVAAYWKEFGSRIGDEVAAAPPPAAAGNVRSRAVRIAPAVVRSITPRNLNIVVERLDLPAGERFDLVVATNVLVYYDVFEQALAVANIAAMLKPGGVFLTNNAVPMKATAEYIRVAYTARQYDDVFWYQRQE